MKAIKTILFTILISVLGFSTAFADNKKESKEKTKSKKETVIYTMTLHGEHCEKIVMKKIPYEKGVINVKADASTQKVTIVYNPQKTTKENLVKAFDKIGFKATEVTPENKDKVIKKDNNGEVAPCCRK